MECISLEWSHNAEGPVHKYNEDSGEEPRIIGTIL